MLDDLSPSKRMQLYCERFGDERGKRWFMEGRTWQQCVELLADELSTIPCLQEHASHLRERIRQDQLRLKLADSLTSKIAAGIYQIEVVLCGSLLADFLVIKGYPKKSRWSVQSLTEREFNTLTFATLDEARRFCVRTSV